jgi:4,5-dihydroxyphthalate decarboxylase
MLEEMLLAGEIDAVMGPERLLTFRESGGRIRRLLTDYETAERSFFRQTGFFPIMHVVAMRRDVYESNPWIARSLTAAFREAKSVGMARMRNLAAPAVSLPWLADELDDLDTNFGGDVFPIGMGPNLEILSAMTEFSYEQGLTPVRVRAEELFAPETLDYVP